MKSIFKKSCVLLSFFMLIFSVSLFMVGCKEEIVEVDVSPFISRYSEKEHRERVESVLIERERLFLGQEYSENEVIAYDIQTVYSYWSEEPEYMVITLEHQYPLQVEIDNKIYETKFRHTILRIDRDRYFFARNYNLFYSKNINFGSYVLSYGFRWGVSPYEAYGHLNDKKYYGEGNFSIEKNGSVVSFLNQSPMQGEIYVWLCGGEYDYKEKTLTEDEQKKLLHSDREHNQGYRIATYWDFSEKS